MMSKKDFQAIARALNYTKEAGAPSEEEDTYLDGMRAAFRAVAAACEQVSPRFDRPRFMEACETGKCKGMKS